MFLLLTYKMAIDPIYTKYYLNKIPHIHYPI